MFRNRKKIILIAPIILILVAFIFVNQINAQTLDVGLNYAAQTGLTTTDIRVTIANIIRVMLGLLGVVAVAVIIYGGVVWMTAQGIPEKIEKAKKILIGATIGLVIVLSAFAITSFILNQLLQAVGPVTPAVCGNGICELGENTSNCPDDCPPGPEPCVGPGCYPTPPGVCDDPNPVDDNPWLCIKPDNGQRGQGITVYGGKVGTIPGRLYFQAKEGALPTTYEVEILKCKESDPSWFTPIGGVLSKAVIKVPDSLVLADNKYRLVAELPDGQSSANKEWGLAGRKDIFTLNSETSSTDPILICLVKDDPITGEETYRAKTGDTRYLIGSRFSLNISQNIVTFENVIAALQNAIDVRAGIISLQALVPQTLSGYVQVKIADKKSNALYNTIYCDTNSDCASDCCIANSCRSNRACQSPVGGDCSDQPACTNDGCQEGLYCDTNCKCQEIGVDTPCSSSTTSCIVDDAICGAELYCSESRQCKCQYYPIITSIDPGDGAIGNFVTVSGRGFGDIRGATGQIYFTSSAGGYIAAKIPEGCGAINTWTNFWAIVEVPEGAVSGPVKIVNSDNKEYVYDTGFIVNDIVRPALCNVTTAADCTTEPPLDELDKYRKGTFNTPVLLCGKNFGATKTDLSKALIGGVDFNNLANIDWSDILIKNLTIPNIQPATLPVQIKVGQVNSNPYNFIVLPIGKPPRIDNIDPTFGPAGQYVTIIGSNFGTATGSIEFYQEATGTWVTADTNFGEKCTKFGYWHDNFIIVKVPSGLDIGANKSKIQVITDSGLTSNSVDFSPCTRNDTTCALKPGICAIIPGQAPIGTQNIAIYGDNFGDFVDTKSQVNFFDRKAASVSASYWKKNQVTGLTVPAGALTGPVQLIDASGIVSNRYPFEVTDCRNEAKDYCSQIDPTFICCEKDGICKTASECAGPKAEQCYYNYSFATGKYYGPPRVVEKLLCEDDLQSPSPWKNSKDNCINTGISVTFNQEMNFDDFFSGGFILEDCTNENSDFDKDKCKFLTVAGELDIGDENTKFVFWPENYFLPNHWYRATLVAGYIISIDGVPLDGNNDGEAGGNYIWSFKIRNNPEECTPERIVVNPQEALLEIIGQTRNYYAYALKQNCNILNGDLYDWWWYKINNNVRESDNCSGGGPCIATISRNDADKDGNNDPRQIATAKKQGATYVGAELPGFGINDQDNLLTVDLNIPEIDNIWPDNGDVRPEVVTNIELSGRNFGDEQGNSKVFFEAADGSRIEAELADCAVSWTDTDIKVKVPFNVKDGSYLVVQTSFGEGKSTQTFKLSKNIYPFLCALKPNFGNQNASVNVEGWNFGDANKTVFGGKEYDIGSEIFFDVPPLENDKVKKWSNLLLNFINPINVSPSPYIPVKVSIDPYSEPFADTSNTGIYDPLDEYADINSNSQYDKATYAVKEKGGLERQEQLLYSNEEIFTLAPVIIYLSPDKGPIDQWVTISGYNFGDEEGEVYFSDEQRAALAPCQTASWTNNYIIAIVPAYARSGGVYIKTKTGIESNRKTFTVNNRPLGAGLCALIPSEAFTEDLILATGDRFEDPPEGEIKPTESNLIFTDNENAEITLWSYQNIQAKVPVSAISGDVYVNKSVLVGKACVGFSIGGFCPSNTYEDAYELAPSNALPFRVNKDLCKSGFIARVDRGLAPGRPNWDARDKGFPVIIKDDSGAEIENIYMSIVAPDPASKGGHVYSAMHYYLKQWCSYWSNCHPEEDPTTIYKIGTGFKDTELGRLYKKYIYDQSLNTPANPIGITSLKFTDHGLFSSAYINFTNLIAVNDGSLYFAAPLRFNNIWYIPKIIFHDEINKGENTYAYGLEFVKLPQGLISASDGDYPTDGGNFTLSNAFLIASNGSNIFVISSDLAGSPINDYKGYTIQILDSNWQEQNRFSIANLPQPSYDYVNFSNFYDALLLLPGGVIADNENIYLRPNGYSYRVQQVINWKQKKWVTTYLDDSYFGGTPYRGTSLFYAGNYDWFNGKYWFGPYGRKSTDIFQDPTLPSLKTNLIYSFSECGVGGTPEPYIKCKEDLDCDACGVGLSRCVLGICTPVIKNFTPKSGAIGTWTTIYGCYFGCDEGDVYFWGKKNPNDVYTNNEPVFYQFADTNDSSVNDNDIILKENAIIGGGVLNLDGSSYATTTNIVDLSPKGEEMANGITVAAWIKIPANPAEAMYIVSQGGGNWPPYNWWGVTINTSGGLAFASLYNQNTTINPLVPLNAWTHVVISAWYSKADNTTYYKFYVNGEEKNSITKPNNLITPTRNNKPLTIGAIQWSSPTTAGYIPQYRFNGEMDELRVYNRALVEDEIKRIYDFGYENFNNAEGYNKKGLKIDNPECDETWICSDDGSNDQVIIEVPEKDTTDTIDDAITGPIEIISAQKLMDNTENLVPPNFTITDILPPGICNLIPRTGEKGTKVRIVGDYFGDTAGANDVVNFRQDGTAEGQGFKISSFVTSAERSDCPATGWSNGNICFAVPQEIQDIKNNFVSVIKNITNPSNEWLWTYQLGLCGNGIINNPPETCDYSATPPMPDIPDQTRIEICKKLFGTDYPLEEITSCTMECNLCDLSFCIDDDCRSIKELCGNQIIDFYKGVYEEDCDTTNLNNKTCEKLGLGPGDLACFAFGTENQCKFDYSDCEYAAPKVQSTVPSHQGDFCRNGIIDIYFDSLIDPKTINKDNFQVGKCDSPLGAWAYESSDKGIFAYIKNIAKKILGFNSQALAETVPVGGTNCDLFDPADYYLKTYNVYGRTQVAIITTRTGAHNLYDPDTIYTVGIIGGDTGVKNFNGVPLDGSNSPINLGEDYGNSYYIFEIKTLGTASDSQSGICNVKDIDFYVYSQPFGENITGTSCTSDGDCDIDACQNGSCWMRPAEMRDNDLFICAGKDDCELDIDFDQDNITGGNQHIYMAMAKYTEGMSLKATYTWSKTDKLDPKKVLTLYNNQTYDDGNTDGNIIDPPDPYRVQNSNGIVYVTAAPVKESVSKLSLQAQAEGTVSTPVQAAFTVYTLLCENPWPSFTEKFPVSSIINAYNFQTYYCRDAGAPGPEGDLPAASYLSPQGQNTLSNTDFENGNLSSWITLGGLAFKSQPVYGDITNTRDRIPSYLQGNWWLNTQENFQNYPWQNILDAGQGTSPIGVLSSQAFNIEGNQIKIKIGGSNNAWPTLGVEAPASLASVPTGVTAVTLEVKDPKVSDKFYVKYQATGADSPSLAEVTFDVTDDIGKIGIIRIYDNNTGGYITFDNLQQYKSGNRIDIKY